MFGSITKLFSGLFSLLGSILTFPLKIFSSGKGKNAAPQKKSGEAFFLEEGDAKGFKAPETKAPKAKAKSAAAPAPTTAVAPASATAAALNLPQPTVTTAAAPVNNYAKFGPARRPGANMKAYLDMAKTMKGA